MTNQQDRTKYGIWLHHQKSQRQESLVAPPRAPGEGQLQNKRLGIWVTNGFQATAFWWLLSPPASWFIGTDIAAAKHGHWWLASIAIATLPSWEVHHPGCHENLLICCLWYRLNGRRRIRSVDHLLFLVGLQPSNVETPRRAHVLKPVRLKAGP